MAEGPYGRTFPGDPNPPPRAPEAPAVSTAPAAAVESEGGGSAGPAAGGAATPSRPAKAVFRVSADEDGRQSVYMMDDNLETSRLGPVSVTNADDLLHALGTFNETTKSWSVPEKAARELISGDLPVPDYVPAKYRANKALIARGAVMTEWMSGKLDLESALARADLETLKMQVKEAPLFVWQGDVPKTVARMWTDLKDAGVSGTARRTAGEVAGMAAFASDTPFLVAGGLTLGASLIAAQTAPGAGQAAAGVVAVALVKGMETTAGALVFKRSYEIEGGNAAAEMLDRGFDEKTVRKYAPVVGVINGALEIVSFRLLAAPFKRTILRNVLGNQAVRKTLATAAFNYAKGLTGEITQEEAQEAVNIIAESMAADSEGRPELAPKGDEILTRGMEIGLKTLMGAGAGPLAVGAVVEGGAAVIDARRGAKPGAAAPAPAAGAPAAAAPAPQGKPVEVVDPKGDYFQTPADRLGAAIEKADAGKASSAELQSAVDELTGSKSEGGPRTYGEKVVEVERKAHVAALQEELAATETQMKALELERARYERDGRGTKVIDRRIEKLNEEATDIRGNVEFHTNIGPKNLMLEESQRLSMSPSTLEAAVDLGFKEGRKEVLDVRRKKVLSIAEKLDLTPAEVREAMGARNYGTMSDAQFDHWFNGEMREGAKERTAGFVDKAKAALRERVAREHVTETIKEREIVGERNIRALHDLPAIGAMTEKQLFDFADLLNTYEEGSKALTPKAVKALQTGPYKTARTMQDVLRLAAEKQKRPMEELLGARRDQFDYLRGDVALAEKHPLYAAVVDPVQQARARAAAKHAAWHETNVRLGAEALASRGSVLGRFLDPTQPEVMKHLETDPALVYAGQVDPATLPKLTTAEQRYVDFLRDTFREVRGYLRLTGELEKSRFENSYYPHVQQSFMEVLKAIPDRGVKAAFRDMLAGIANSHDKLTVPMASDERAAGYLKFFKQTMFRAGDITPSAEVMRVADDYMRDFFEKQELDVAGPEALTLVRSVLSLETDKSPDMVKARGAVEQLVKDYINNKKGINLTFEKLAPRGGLIDVMLRTASSFISVSRIALNLPLEITAPLGENLAATQVTGHLGYAKAQARMLTKEGRALLANHEAFVGKGQWGVLLEPGRNAEQRAATIMYGLLQVGRTHALKSILLALATDAELKAGKMSPARLAEIERHTGRWVDIHGMKSVVGSTTPGAAYTKFRTWMLPIMRSTIQDLGAAVGALRGKKAMTSQQRWELVNIAFNTSVAAVALFAVKPDDEDKSALANVRRRALNELFSILHGANPLELLKPGPVVKFYDDLYSNLKLLWVLEQGEDGEYHVGARYKKDTNQHQEGDLKGPPALGRQLVPAMFRQFKAPEEEK